MKESDGCGRLIGDLDLRKVIARVDRSSALKRSIVAIVLRNCWWLGSREAGEAGRPGPCMVRARGATSKILPLNRPSPMLNHVSLWSGPSQTCVKTCTQIVSGFIEICAHKFYTPVPMAQPPETAPLVCEPNSLYRILLSNP
jgi:hypothetical protein